MEKEKRQSLSVTIMALGVLVMGVLFTSYTSAIGANEERVEGLVDRARVTFREFMQDPTFAWLRENIDQAKGVLIFPQVLKGGFIFGGSGGTGVFLVRDSKTGEWSQPAFYTMGSVTFGLQIGGESSEIVMMAMTPKAIDSLFSTSFKLGADVSVAVGPIGAGAKASADVPTVTADFITFVKSKGLYGGLNIEGAVIAVRDSLNQAYYGKMVRPVDIIEKRVATNRQSAELRESLKCKC